jgi:ribosomal protein S18 acetylase RimI-like enzyme
MVDRAFLARIRAEPLDRAKHDRAAFSCGDDHLNNFLKNTAGRQHEQDIARVTVACLDDSPVVIGYYALNASFVDVSTLPEPDQKRLPRYPTIPAIYLSKLGVQDEHQGQGLGEYLVAHAFNRCVKVADEIGAYFLVLDALNERSAKLYRRLGFVDLVGHEPRMLIKMSIVREAATKSASPLSPTAATPDCT